MAQKPVVIIGGGLAGLACAVHLKKRNLPVLVLEKESHVGGRVQSVKENGFTFDVGFQVVQSSYPEWQHTVDLKKLNLEKFNSGAMIYAKAQKDTFDLNLLANPLQHPEALFSTLFANIIGFKDKLLVANLLRKAFSEENHPAKNQTTLHYLESQGFSKRFIDIFWKPFLSGVLLDANLSADASYLLFLLRNFATGAITVPSQGMAAIPEQMAETIGRESILTNSKVKSFSQNKVELEDGRVFEASAVVCANNSDQPDSSFFSVSTYYFVANQKSQWGKWLVLIPKEMNLNINHLVALSEIAPGYAPHGQYLVSANVVGNSSVSEEIIKNELKYLSRGETTFQWLKTFHVRRALPTYNGNASGVMSKNGIIYCGDHLSTPSINGALYSGRQAAELAWKSLS